MSSCFIDDFCNARIFLAPHATSWDGEGGIKKKSSMSCFGHEGFFYSIPLGVLGCCFFVGFMLLMPHTPPSFFYTLLYFTYFVNVYYLD
jgi:hypothetical protein